MHFIFALRYFKGKKSANAINIISRVTVTVIAFATCCQILVLSVFNGFEGLVKSLYSSFYSDFRVTPAKGKTFFLTAAQINNVKQQPFVEGLSMMAEEKAVLQIDSAQTFVTIKGVDSVYKRISGVPANTNNGEFETGNAENPKLVAGYGVQEKIGINVNEAFPASDVTVILPRKTTSSAITDVMSEGVAKASGVFIIQQDIDNQFAISDIGFVKTQMDFGVDEYSAIELKIKAGTTESDANKALEKIFGRAFKIQSRYEQNANLYRTMTMEKWAIYAVLTLILIIAAFNMVSALMMLVLEKRKDISILRSMGTTSAGIQRIFLAEGLLLGVSGAAAGIILALIICLLQMKFHLIKIIGGSFVVDYFPVKMVFTDFLTVAGTAIAITFLAAWFPSYKASKQQIALK